MRCVIPLLMLVAPVAAMADSNLPAAPLANTQLADPTQEETARALMETIRCLVCDGQSVADSDAEMAGDMRALIRQRVQAGESAGSIKAWLIDRYGPGITFDPPFRVETMFLWVAPFILIILGAILMRSRIKVRRP